MALGAISLSVKLQGGMTSQRDITPGIKVMDLHDRVRYGDSITSDKLYQKVHAVICP